MRKKADPIFQDIQRYNLLAGRSNLGYQSAERVEPEWVTTIRNYCREKRIAPTTLITAYEELKQPIFAFLYCDNVWEGGPVSMSYHRSKEAAYKAMKAHKIEQYNNWASCSRYFRLSIKWNNYQAWIIREINIQD